MLGFTIVLTLAGALAASLLTVQVMATRIDGACRKAELVRDTRRLRTKHRLEMPPPRQRRR